MAKAMSESPSIVKKNTRDGAPRFEALRRAGISHIQDFSGKEWTDYNVHDPGVTILEQLCYALTDLAYRADFKVEDYLTQADGRIDSARQALHPPEQIFPARPTTVNDYRKLIFDAVAELDNVWLHEVTESGPGGVYRVMLRLKDDVDESRWREIADKVRLVYARHRNLCEDIGGIDIIRDLDCEIIAEIEVNGSASAADILARIYYECANQITSGIRLYPYEEALNSGKHLDEIFSGPLCTYGYIKDEELDAYTQELVVADLIAAVKEVPGVERIKGLMLEKDGVLYDTSLRSDEPGAALRLRIPDNAAGLKIKLFKDGRAMPVSMREFKARYDEISFSRRSRIHAIESMRSLYTPPRGQYRKLNEYVSIQNEFPVIYGINMYGLPASASAQDKARARQLKAYLVLFEQILANHSANLHAVDELFSTETASARSYAFQTLSKQSIHDLDAIYPDDPASVIAGIMKRYEDYAERKGRLLEYILALYGEVIPQDALKHFNAYSYSDELTEILIENKAALLKHIVDVTKDRAGAFDYSLPAWNRSNIAGLKRKLDLLLGFKHQQNRSLTLAILKRGLKLIPDDVYRNLKEGTLDLRFTALEDIEEHIHHVFRAVPAQEEPVRINIKKMRRNLDNVTFLRQGFIPQSLFTDGIQLDCYRVGSLSEDDDCQLVFRAPADNDWSYLGNFPEIQDAIEAAHALRRFLAHLNIESEGVHILEHILLRPEAGTSHDGLHIANDEDFYSFRFSVFFSAWSVRCQDKNFRMLAEDLVRRECPAHLYPDIYWLNFNQMDEFERHYREWLDEKSTLGVNADKLNGLAKRLIQFLHDLRVNR